MLDAHQGCVNRLAWNEEGTRLASGSDDRKVRSSWLRVARLACVMWTDRVPVTNVLQVMIWSAPGPAMPPLSVSTHHRANIFGVQFLPCTGDTKVVTAAMDHTVQVGVLLKRACIYL